MEQSFDHVAKKCGKQLDDFQRCLLSNRSDPDGGASKCAQSREALTTCASEAVPLVAAIKRRCQPQIQAYDACIQSKPSRPLIPGNEQDEAQELTERCTPALRNLWRCTEQAKQIESEALGIKRPDPGSVGMGGQSPQAVSSRA